MHADARKRSWQVSARPLKGAALAALFIVGVAGTCEVAARTDAARRVLAPSSYGTRIRFFDLQMARLDALVRAHDPIDCIFLGSSGALQAFDPQVFARTYAEQTGRRLHCFNFGLPGASVRDVRALAPILKRDYGARVIVYGFTVRDVSNRALELRLEDAPWIMRRTTAFNLDGFLTDASAAFRYFAALRRWMDANREEPFATFPIRDDGFFEAHGLLAPSAVVTGWELQMVGQSDGNYDPRSFSRLIALGQTGAQVVLVELPRSPAIAAAIAIPEAARTYTPAYREFRTRLAAKAENAAVVFIEAPPPEIVPAEGWADLVHMNWHGAALFSRWAAERAATAVGRKASAMHDETSAAHDASKD